MSANDLRRTVLKMANGSDSEIYSDDEFVGTDNSKSSVSPAKAPKEAVMQSLQSTSRFS